jgi:uncharacterized membrane protein YgcG
MAEASASTTFSLRRWLFRLAWLLLVGSLLVPAPAGLPTVGPLGISAAYVYAQALAWNAEVPGAPGSLGFWAETILALALYSHIAFVYALYLRDDRGVAVAWKGLLLVALVVNACIALVVPAFARLPAYWVWLAAFAVLTVGFVGFGGDNRASRAASPSTSDIDRGDVPAFVWVLLAFTFFWIAVSAVNHALPPRDEALRAARDALTGYVNDRAHVLNAAQTSELISALQKFEATTPSQVAVAIYPSAPEGSIDDFTIRAAERFPLGRAGLDTGAILFVFMKERAARLEVGYGLEGTLTDAAAHRILDDDLAPAFARAAYFEGLDATLEAIFANVRDAYKQDRTPGTATTWRRKLVAQRPTKVERMWRALTEASLAARIGAALLGALVGLALWQGVFHRSRFARAAGRGAGVQGVSDWGRFIRDIGRGIANLRAKRPFAEGMERFDGSTIVDSLRLGFWTIGILLPTAGVLLIAGGGSFGGAGSLIHW